jgi:phage-related protein
MKGITFGNYHSFRDFRLILSPNSAIGTPTPKTELLDIPGGDGVLDFTEAFGEVKYNNRPLSFEFSTMVPQSEFMTLFSQVQNALHGQKMKIVLDDDPGSYYIGRITVSEWKADRLIGTLTIDCDCEPFKYTLKSQTVYLTGEAVTVTLFNSGKRTAIPKANTTGTATAETDAVFATLTEGLYTMTEFPLKAGEGKTLTFEGNGSDVVEWLERGL